MRITELNYDILENIDRYLYQRERKRLAASCTQFMEWQQKRAYSTVYLREDSSSGKALLTLASGPRAKFVKHLQYKPADIKGDADEEDEDSKSDSTDTNSSSDETRKAIKNGAGNKDDDASSNEDTDTNPLSDETRKVLESLSSFPNLERFDFITDHWNIGDWKHEAGDNYLYFGPDRPRFPDEEWFALVNESLSALSDNRRSFTHLTMKGLPPTVYPAHCTQDWEMMLSTLLSLTVELPEFEEYPDGSIGGLNWCDDDYLYPLVPDFLGPLQNATYVHIAGKKDGIIGNDNQREPVAWSKINIPQLEVFKLEWCVIQGELLQFLNSHYATLKEIHLENCIVLKLSWWTALFKQIRKSQSTKLIEFRATQAPPRKPEVAPGQFYVAEFDGEYGDVRVNDDPPDSDSDLDDDLDDVLAELSNVQAMVAKNKSIDRT